MRKLVISLIASLFFIPLSWGNKLVSVSQQEQETIIMAAEDINSASFTSTSNPASSHLHISSQQKTNTGFSTRSHAFMPAALLSIAGLQRFDTRTTSFNWSYQTYCTRIGLQLLFPKHYFW